MQYQFLESSCPNAHKHVQTWKPITKKKQVYLPCVVKNPHLKPVCGISF